MLERYLLSFRINPSIAMVSEIVSDFRVSAIYHCCGPKPLLVVSESSSLDDVVILFSTYRHFKLVYIFRILDTVKWSGRCR